MYVTTGGSDALESNWTLPSLVEAVEDGHGDVRGRREERDAESASPRSEPTRGRTICDGEEPRASEANLLRCHLLGRPGERSGAVERGRAAPREGTVPTPANVLRCHLLGDLASGVEQSNVVELLRGKALCRLPPNSTLHPVGQRTETATEKSWPPRGGSLLQPPLLRNGRSEERVRVSW